MPLPSPHLTFPHTCTSPHLTLPHTCTSPCLTPATLLTLHPRSVAGSYDNEGIAIFALMFTYYLWIKAVKTGSMYYGACTAMVGAGGWCAGADGWCAGAGVVLVVC